MGRRGVFYVVMLLALLLYGSGASLGAAAALASSGTASVSGAAFNDLNGDGTRQDDEPGLAGVLVALQDSGGATRGLQLTGSDGQFAFANLSAGRYTVMFAPPAGARPTTPATVGRTLMDGQSVTLQFGAVPAPPTATPAPSPTPTVTSTLTPTRVPGAPVPAACGAVYQGNTTGHPARLDGYAVRPDLHESGPEDVYVLTLSHSGAFSATLYIPRPYPDLDLFLLSTPSAAVPPAATAAIAYGNNFIITPTLAAGIYYLVVDGYQGAQGTYALSIECPGEVQATASPTPSATASRTPTGTPTAKALPSASATATAFATWTAFPSDTPVPTPSNTPTRFRAFGYLPVSLHGWPPPTPPLRQLSLQQNVDGYTGEVDTYVERANPNQPAEGRTWLSVRTQNGANSLLRFDLTGLPRNASIVSATLTLFALERSNDTVSDTRGDIYFLLRPWNAGQATWNQASVGQLWQAAGASGDADRWPDPLVSVPLQSPRVWYNWDVTYPVRLWAAQPERNFGLLVQGGGVGQVEFRFASAERGTELQRPLLSITYWVPAPGVP